MKNFVQKLTKGKNQKLMWQCLNHNVGIFTKANHKQGTFSQFDVCP